MSDTREHVTDSPDCWCNPAVENFGHDPEEGSRMSYLIERVKCWWRRTRKTTLRRRIARLEAEYEATAHAHGGDV